MTQDTRTEDEQGFEGLDECFWSVVREHGREMFLLVFNANVAGEATQHLAAIAGRFAQGSASGRQNAAEISHAVAVIASAFNVLSNGLCAKHGWTAEQLAACQSAIEQAWAGKVRAEEGPRIVLH